MPSSHGWLSFLAVVLIAATACRSTPARLPDPVAAAEAWANVPLNPRLDFTEAAAPRSVHVLVLDAHSGAPLQGAVVTLTPANRTVGTDSLGHASLPRVPLGHHQLLIRRLSYQFWRDSITVLDTAALILVVQLRRSSATFYDPATVKPPPL